MVDALTDLGGLCWQEGDYDEARRLLERAIAIEPTFRKAWLNLGLVHGSRGDDAAALEAFRSAVRVDPGSVQARNVLAEQLLARGLVDEAVSTMEEAVRRHRQNPNANLGLAKALVEARQGARALRHLERVLAREDASLEALELQAWVLATSPAVRDPQRALRAAERCMQLSQGAWSSLRVMAAALAATGALQEAARCALEAAARAPVEHQDELMAMQERFRAGQVLDE